MSNTKSSTYQYDIQAPDGSIYTIEAPSNDSTTPLKQKSGLQTSGDILGQSAFRTFQAGPTSFNNITGGIGTQFGHDVKAVSLERQGVHPIIAEALSTATDPQSILGGMIEGGSGLGNLGFRSAKIGALERLGSMKFASKGRNVVSRLLPTANIATEISQNKIPGIQSEGLNIIKATNNPKDVVKKFRVERQNVINQVDNLVLENNQPVQPNFLKSRVKTILQKQFDNSTPKERIKLKDAIKDETNWIDEQGDFNTVKANSRKRFLYQETQNLQKKQAKGIQIFTQPEKQLVKDAFAQAYKEAIERTNLDIKKLNSRFSGLDSGLIAAAKFAESSIKEGPVGERIASQIAGRPSLGSGIAAFVRELPFIGKSTKRLTSQIEKFSKKSSELMVKSRLKQAPILLDKFMQDISNKQYFQSLASPETIQSLVSPQEKLSLPLGRSISGVGFETISPGAQLLAQENYQKRLFSAELKKLLKRRGL